MSRSLADRVEVTDHKPPRGEEQGQGGCGALWSLDIAACIRQAHPPSCPTAVLQPQSTPFQPRSCDLVQHIDGSRDMKPTLRSLQIESKKHQREWGKGG